MTVFRTRRSVVAGLAALGTLAAPGYLRAQSADQGTLGLIRKTGKVRVGWAIYYPAIFHEPGKDGISGIMVDYMKLMGEALGAQVEWVEDNTATLIAGLQSNKFDLTLPLGITPARAQATTFPKPLLREGLALLTTKKALNGRAGWESFNKSGTRISVTLGSNSDVAVTRIFTNAEIVRVRSESESLALVLAGRVDAKSSGRSALRLMMRQRPEVAEVPNSLFFESPMAPAVRKGDTEFAAWIDEFTEKQKKNGNLLKILQGYDLDESFIWTKA